MIISMDNLLGDAKRISSKRDSSGASKDKGSSVRTDRADIEHKADARLESVSSELRSVQNSLSEKQLIKNGLDEVMDHSKQGKDVSSILEKVKYEGRKVLLDYLGASGDQLTMQLLTSKNSEIESKIAQDTKSLTRLQVESENILASSLSDNGKAAETLDSIHKMMNEKGYNSNISRLNPEAVMRLIRS